MRLFPALVLALALPLPLWPATAHVLGAESPPPGCARPDAGSSPPAVSDDVVRGLLEWIGGATDYDIGPSLAAPPEIGFCRVGEWVEYEDNRFLVEEDLRAVYDWPNRRVLIVAPWDPADKRDLSILLHELVHHVQMQTRDWECLQASEWQAYKLQERWLAEQGIDAGFDWLHIYFLSRCPRDIHPD